MQSKHLFIPIVKNVCGMLPLDILTPRRNWHFNTTFIIGFPLKWSSQWIFCLYFFFISIFAYNGFYCHSCSVFGFQSGNKCGMLKSKLSLIVYCINITVRENLSSYCITAKMCGLMVLVEFTSCI